ncbi:hypothetical protein MMC19_000619 [Ptychographa xylographoides]|nr:hypothetical protein [Ptychographa xylographoides]
MSDTPTPSVHTDLKPLTTQPVEPKPTDTQIVAGRGGYNDSPNPTVVVSPEHPTFGGRGGYNAGPSSQHGSPRSGSPKDPHSVPYPPPNTHFESPNPQIHSPDAQHHAFGGRGSHPTSPQSHSPVPAFAISRHGSLSSEHGHGGFAGRGGYNAGIAAQDPSQTPEVLGPAGRRVSEMGPRSDDPHDHGFGGRGGYNAAPHSPDVSPGAFGHPHRAETFADFEARRRSASSPAHEHGFGGRGGYNAGIGPEAARSPEHFGQPHRAETFADFEAQRRGSELPGHEHGFGGRGGYNAAVGPDIRRASEVGATAHPSPYDTARRVSETPSMHEHGFGGRGGYNASVGSPDLAPPGHHIHRAETFSQFEAEREQERQQSGTLPGHEDEEQRDERDVPTGHHELREAETFPLRPEEGSHPGFGGRGGYNERAPHGAEGADHEDRRGLPGGDEGPEHPEFGGRGGYNASR